MLTVAIPTYNRNEILNGNLKLLLPQLNESCRLLILDNCSPVPVEDTSRELLAQYPGLNCQIVRNIANIGANANILRCIELCETPWVWILGDDDAPLPGAIPTILEETKAHPDCVLLNFAIDEQREREWTTRGVEEVAHSLDASADLPWISSSVYRTRDFKANLKFGYQYIYSMLPHIAVMLVALDEKGACYFSRKRIMNSEVRDLDIPVNQQWSSINLALGYPILFDMPMKPAVRELLFKRLTRTNLRPGNGLRNVAFELLLLAMQQRDGRSARHYFDQIRRRQEYSFSRSQKVEAFVYGILLRFPRLGARVYRLVKGRPLQVTRAQDRFNRM